MKAWEILNRNGRSELRKDEAALKVLMEIRKNPKFASIGLTDDMIGKIKGFKLGSYDVSFAQAVTKIEELVSALPSNNTQGIDKFLGSSGFTNGSPSAVRSAYVTCEYLIKNKNKLLNSFVDFESDVSHNLINSVTDVRIVTGNEIINIETKAGDEFFSFVASSGTNFVPQSYNMFLDVNKIENLRIVLNKDVLSSLSDRATFIQQKTRVIQAWKVWNNGKLFNDPTIRAKFSSFF